MKNSSLSPLRAEIFARRIDGLRALEARRRKLDGDYYNFHFTIKRIQAMASSLSEKWPKGDNIERVDDARTYARIQEVVTTCPEIAEQHQTDFQSLANEIAEQASIWGYKPPDKLSMGILEASYLMTYACRTLSDKRLWARSKAEIMSELDTLGLKEVPETSSEPDEWTKFKRDLEAKLELDKVS